MFSIFKNIVFDIIPFYLDKNVGDLRKGWLYGCHKDIFLANFNFDITVRKLSDVSIHVKHLKMLAFMLSIII